MVVTLVPLRGYGGTGNTNSQQIIHLANPNPTQHNPKSKFLLRLNSWPSHLPLPGAMAELEYQLTMNNSSRQPKSNAKKTH
ncbi:Hypothetical protein FKW44_005738 [Caligus rogercresseyi]|uniref:Uncharacterized protein n=1 Tax=Caligus rogercresseyi TaxID=217165 RepID=A0A7T8QS97_CALRO|nr:Hypothetical protein FKW44_005738 [Caligus rogercresseyi]